ncbi:TetR/AcrR family transcriptional regulator [Streptomyces iconiensis]|uniref:TetR family transcriptional regulator n=1 Tax=Streptomyces iconiensis TaxID=1384038 RepID=A0ABT7A9X6_9ACTN|nr:TetR/AcrR family transcriptional regulator [Streptomyces iconiensis]MDJ1138100.1 TetR family transcriptional regulator [Streptomyces iconiensis]
MRQNPQRRIALLDAAIEVLAREGSRGLTLRAVDKEAGVPTGTASNYFAHRGDMLTQVMRRTRERLMPDETALAETMKAERTQELVVTLMGQLVERLRTNRSCHLAMLELRLESTRRPELNEELSRFLGAELENNIAFNRDAGLPGDDAGIVVLYLAMWGLLVDHLTVPGILEPWSIDQLIEEMVPRILTAPSADTD